MTATGIPTEVRHEAVDIIGRFNREVLGDSGCRYVPHFRGKHLYLHREDFGKVGPVCRLEYKKRKRLWEFAIYKYSTDRYDPDDCFFPGSEFVDGTVEGALAAGLTAYP